MRAHTQRQRLRKIRLTRRTPPGATPGTLSPDPTAPRPVIELISYGPDGLEEAKAEKPADLRAWVGRRAVTWINVDGLGDAQTVRQLAEIFGLHPLAQEDVLNTYQRAKVEPYGAHLFIVCRAFYVRNDRLETEQLSLYVGENFLLTFQEIPGPDCWDPVRNRLRQAQGNLRGGGTDYLAYALLDAVIDSYFPVLEEFGERLETQEEAILVRPDSGTIQTIHVIKRELFMLRRAVWPLREAVNVLVRDPVPLIRADTRIFLRDCYDHCVQLIDLIETYRELGSDLTDVYLSSVSFRTNEIMRFLTVVTSVFIPLTFLAGIWGMNFDPDTSPLNMPELRWFWGYPFALVVMAAIAGLMLLVFRRRGWLGSPERQEIKPDSKAPLPPPSSPPHGSAGEDR